MHSWEAKLVFYQNMSVRTIFLTAIRLQGQYKGQKRAKIGPKGGSRITYHVAKQDFKAPKLHSSVVKLVCHLKVSVRSIIVNHSKALGAYKGQKRAKIGPKWGLKHKIAYYGAIWEMIKHFSLYSEQEKINLYREYLILT